MSPANATGPGPSTSPRAESGNRPSLRKALHVFEYRNYRYLWASTALFFTGMSMQQVARALLAWELTHSYAAVGWVSLSFGLPMVLFGLLGGAVADRFDRRNLIFMVEVAAGVLMFITAGLVATDLITIQQLIVIGLAQGTFFAFGMPARTPLMAQVVGPENVMGAIAMSNAAMNATRLIGPAIAGILVATYGMEFAYWAQSVCYALAAGMLLFIPAGLSASLRGERPAHESILTEVKQGIAYVAGDRTLRLLLGVFVLVSVVAAPYMMLLAGYVERDLHAGPDWYGYLQSASGIGAIVSSVAIATLTDFDRKPLLMWLAGVLTGLGLVLLTFASRSFGLEGATGAIILLGVALTMFQTLNHTMYMNAAQPQYYGRVMSIHMLAFNLMPLMTAPLGMLADAIGGGGELFIIQGVIVVAGLLVVAAVNGRFTFGRTDEAAWRAAAYAASEQPAVPTSPALAATVNARGSAAARLHAPVAHAPTAPSGGRDGSGFPAQTGAVQASSRDVFARGRASEEPGTGG